jgi:hypothetical protein
MSAAEGGFKPLTFTRCGAWMSLLTVAIMPIGSALTILIMAFYQVFHSGNVSLEAFYYMTMGFFIWHTAVFVIRWAVECCARWKESLVDWQPLASCVEQWFCYLVIYITFQVYWSKTTSASHTELDNGVGLNTDFTAEISKAVALSWTLFLYGIAIIMSSMSLISSCEAVGEHYNVLKFIQKKTSPAAYTQVANGNELDS